MNIYSKNINLEAIKLKDMIIQGYKIKIEDLDILKNIDIELLSNLACEIRDCLSDGQFELCTIINGKSGRCSENCSFCAQSIHHQTDVEEYNYLDDKKIIDSALENFKNDVSRFSIVTSGRKLSNRELDRVCQQFEAIKKLCPINLCSSSGLLDLEQFKKLKKYGVTRYHNNLETSKSFFPNICTTHSFDDKLQAIKNAKIAGLSVCSGGIFGLGESIDDRISMAFSLRDLQVDSVPINILNPIKNTPLQNNKILDYDEIRRSIAIYRFILPNTNLRLAGGRVLLKDKGKKAIESGLDSMISGEMLTTSGINTSDDVKMIEDMGFSIKKTNDTTLFLDKLENITEVLFHHKNTLFSNLKDKNSIIVKASQNSYQKNKSGIIPLKNIDKSKSVNRNNSVFISASNTDIGKTYICSKIINILKELSISTGYFKPILSGAYTHNGNLIAGDCEYVVESSNLNNIPNELSSYIFKEAYSPHLAAKFNKEIIKPQKILKDFESILSSNDFTVVEGCGGIVCPIYESNDQLLMQEDLIHLMRLNTILVISSDLGSINAGVTSYNYCVEKNINVLAIVMNKFDVNNIKHIDNKRMIEKITGIRVFFAEYTYI